MKVEWKIRDTLALLVIPLELGLAYILVTALSGSGMIVQALLPFCLKLFSLVLIAFLYHSLLTEHWKRFTKQLWLKLLCCVAGAALMYFALSGVRSLAGIAQSADIMQSITDGLPYGIFLLASFTPVLAPVTEEVVFRHVLFGKFWEHKIWLVIMCLVSAFLFGTVHLGNFGGRLWLTTPYMAIGLLYNLIYYFSKNIWYSVIIHLMFNFAQSVIPTLLIPFLIAGIQ
jgi:membrane protease YdiL (CAAX protease family)